MKFSFSSQTKHTLCALGIGVLGVVGFSVGAVRLKQQLVLQEPAVDESHAVNPSANELLFGDSRTSDQSLRQKDTDRDGLNDYEEINVYHTSPYLADSDGDKKTDSEEALAETDPNCPEGTQCRDTQQPTSSSAGISNPADQIRATLKASGMTDEQVNALSNEQLNQTYMQVLDEQRVQQEQQAQSVQSGNKENVSADALREALLKQGVSKGQLDGVSDEELLQTFQDANQE